MAEPVGNNSWFHENAEACSAPSASRFSRGDLSGRKKPCLTADAHVPIIAVLHVTKEDRVRLVLFDPTMRQVESEDERRQRLVNDIISLRHEQSSGNEFPELNHLCCLRETLSVWDYYGTSRSARYFAGPIFARALGQSPHGCLAHHLRSIEPSRWLDPPPFAMAYRAWVDCVLKHSTQVGFWGLCDGGQLYEIPEDDTRGLAHAGWAPHVSYVSGLSNPLFVPLPRDQLDARPFYAAFMAAITLCGYQHWEPAYVRLTDLIAKDDYIDPLAANLNLYFIVMLHVMRVYKNEWVGMPMRYVRANADVQVCDQEAPYEGDIEPEWSAEFFSGLYIHYVDAKPDLRATFEELRQRFPDVATMQQEVLDRQRSMLIAGQSPSPIPQTLILESLGLSRYSVWWGTIKQSLIHDLHLSPFEIADNGSRHLYNAMLNDHGLFLAGLRAWEDWLKRCPGPAGMAIHFRKHGLGAVLPQFISTSLAWERGRLSAVVEEFMRGMLAAAAFHMCLYLTAYGTELEELGDICTEENRHWTEVDCRLEVDELLIRFASRMRRPPNARGTTIADVRPTVHLPIEPQTGIKPGVHYDKSEEEERTPKGQAKKPNPFGPSPRSKEKDKDVNRKKARDASARQQGATRLLSPRERGIRPQAGGLFAIDHNHHLELGDSVTRFQQALRDDINSALGMVLGVFSNMSNQWSQRLERAANTAGSGLANAAIDLNSFAKKLFVHVPLVGFLCYGVLARLNHASALASAALAAMALFGMDETVVHLFGNWMRRPAIEAQAGGMDNTSGVGVILSTIVCTALNQRLHESFASCLIKSVPKIMKDAPSWSSAMNWCITACESLINAVLSYCGRDNIQLRSKFAHEVERWLADIEEVSKDFHNCTLSQDINSMERLKRLRIAGMGLMTTYGKDEACYRYMSRALSQLDKVLETYGPIIARNTITRPEPVCLGLFGDPGVGKSTLAKFGVQYIISHFYDDPDRCDKEIWSKSGTSQFWESYSGQFAYIMDDFGQKVEKPGGDTSDYLDLIKCVNQWPMPLDMAALQHKGKWFFTSEMVLVTSNLHSIRKGEEVINDLGAIQRRINHCYWLQVKPEWQNPEGYFDYRRWERAVDTDPELDMFEPWVAVPYDIVTGRQTAAGVPLRQVLDAVVLDIQQRRGGVTVDERLRRRAFEAARKRTTTELRAQAGGQEDEPPFGEDPVRLFQTGVYLDAISNIANIVEIQPEPIPQHVKDRAAGLLEEQVAKAKARARGNVAPADDDDFQDAEDRKEVDDATEDLFRRGFFASSLRSLTFSFAVYKEELESTVRWIATSGLVALCTFALAGVGLFYLAKAAWGWFSKPSKNKPSKTQRHRKWLNWNKMMGNAKSEEPPSPVEAQMGKLDDNLAAMYSNMIIIEMKDKSGKWVLEGNLLGVTAHWAIMPAHFDLMHKDVAKNDPEREYKLTYLVSRDSLNKTPTYFTLRAHELAKFQTQRIPEQDVVLIKLPLQADFRTIIGRFALDSDFTNPTPIAMRYEMASYGFGVPTRMPHPGVAKPAQRDVEYNVSNIGRIRNLRTLECDVGGTSDGDCGAVLIATEGRHMARPIFGIHIAGDPERSLTRLSYAAFVSQEQLKNALEQADPRYVKGETPDKRLIVAQAGEVPPPIEGNFRAYAKLGGGLCYSSPVETKLRQSPLYGKFGPQDRRPAMLRPGLNSQGIKVNPIIKATQKYGGPCHIYDPDKVKMAVWVALTPFMTATKDYDRKCRTFEEAVKGFPGLVNSIPRSTSPGYPYVLESKKDRGKEAFFGKEDDYQFTSQKCKELEAEVDRIITEARTGVRNVHVWADFLKDELRPSHKVDEGATRLISSCPLAYLIAYRMLFIDFMRACVGTRITNGMAVGVNVYQEWGMVASWLSAMGDTCVAGDYAAYDCSQQPQIHQEITRAINTWYGDSEENQQAREILTMEVYNSRHLGGPGVRKDDVYQWTHSLPSGHPATSLLNSIYNLVLFIMAWDHLGQDMGTFWQFVRILVYGDDNLLSIHASKLDVFNQHTITRAMSELHMTYTDESKLGNDVVPPHRPLKDCTFLKRGFREEVVEGKPRTLAPLAMETVRCVTYWLRTDKEWLKNMRDNADFMLRELAMHAEKEWAALAPAVFRECLSLGFAPSYPQDRQVCLKAALMTVERLGD